MTYHSKFISNTGFYLLVTSSKDFLVPSILVGSGKLEMKMKLEIKNLKGVQAVPASQAHITVWTTKIVITRRKKKEKKDKMEEEEEEKYLLFQTVLSMC